jgi:hypothetical protein
MYFVSSRRIGRILSKRDIKMVCFRKNDKDFYSSTTTYYYINGFFVGDFENFCLSISVSGDLEENEKAFFRYTSSHKKSTCETRKINFHLKKIANILFSNETPSTLMEYSKSNKNIKEMYKEILNPRVGKQISENCLRWDNRKIIEMPSEFLA